MRSLTGGEADVDAEGGTLGEVIESLEAAHPGIRARLMEEGRLRSGLAAFVDGANADAGLRTRVAPDSEVYFSPAIAGG